MCRTKPSRHQKEKVFEPCPNPWAQTKLWCSHDLHCLKMNSHHIHMNQLSLVARLHAPTIEVVFGSDGADVVHGGDGDVSVQTNKSSRWKLLFKLGHLSKDIWRCDAESSERSNVKFNRRLTLRFGFKSFNSLKINLVRSAYICLCDLLMDVHVSQSKNHFSALSNNGAVSSCVPPL